jgi:two-component system, NtrC family, sensor kinase
MKKIEPDKVKRAVAVGLTVVALVGVLGFLFQRTRSVDVDGNGEIIGVLRQLKQVDAEWNVDVLRSKTDLNTHSDPVASPLPLIASMQSRLAERTDGAWADDAARTRLAPMLADFTAAMDRKIALIERFRSQNAILRNSSRYVPLAGSELVEAARNRVADKRTAVELQEAAETLVADVMTYLLLPDAPLRAHIEEHDAALGALAPRLPADVAALVEQVRPHVQAVLRQQKIGDDLLVQLAALPTANKLDSLMDAYGQENSRLLAEQQIWTLAMLGYAALLLGLLGWQGWRLFRSDRLLNDSSAALKRADRDLQASQAALVQAEKMSALGQMVAGIAHEINTPLVYVKGTIGVLREHMARVSELAERSLVFTEMLAAKERDPAALSREYTEVRRLAGNAVERGMLNELVKLLEEGAGGIDKISEIVLNLKQFSRLDHARVTSFDVREGLESTLLLARSMLKHRVTVIREFGDVSRIACAPSQINQVFLNLITNAAHAIPEDRAGFLTLRTEMDDDKTVRIEIQDNGTGIRQDVLPKIFDPFFTTRGTREGTGMGLSISHKIVKQHGGAILVDTEVDVGTVFTILLPVEPPPSPAALHEESSVAS